MIRFAFAVALAAAPAGPASAQDIGGMDNIIEAIEGYEPPAPPPPERSARKGAAPGAAQSGTVLSIDRKTGRVKVKTASGVVSVPVTAATRMSKGGKKIRLSGLKAGDKVRFQLSGGIARSLSVLGKDKRITPGEESPVRIEISGPSGSDEAASSGDDGRASASGGEEPGGGEPPPSGPPPDDTGGGESGGGDAGHGEEAGAGGEPGHSGDE